MHVIYSNPSYVVKEWQVRKPHKSLYAKVSFSDQHLLVVRRPLCRCVRCRKLFLIFILFPISTKLGTNLLWMKGIHVCSKEVSSPFPRGDNYKIAKIHWQMFQIFFSRTSGSISAKLGTIRLWVKGIQVCSNEGLCPFSKGEIITKLRKYIDKF